jgi:hypothetical protein
MGRNPSLPVWLNAFSPEVDHEINPVSISEYPSMEG